MIDEKNYYYVAEGWYFTALAGINFQPPSWRGLYVFMNEEGTVLKIYRILLVIVGMICISSSPGWANDESGKVGVKANYDNTVRFLRKNGFTAKTAVWTETITCTMEGKTTTSEAKSWISGDRYRRDSISSEEKQTQRIVVTLDDGQDLYFYKPGQKHAIKFKNSTNFEGVLSKFPTAQETVKKIGTETIAGKVCDVLTFRRTVNVMESHSIDDVKEWMWAEERFPMKYIATAVGHPMIISDEAHKSKIIQPSEETSIVKDVVLNGPIDENLFVLPSEIKVESH